MRLRRPGLAAAQALLALMAIGAAGLTPAAVGARGDSCATTAGHLNVQPFPGTPDAPAQADVAFPALAPREIVSLTVTGSRSGSHRGRLTRLQAGHGTAFLPRRGFATGEAVCVQASVKARSGRPGRIRFSFRVATPGTPLTAPSVHTAALKPDPVDSDGFTYSFHSEPGLHPPLVTTSSTGPVPGEGDIFADTENSIQAGPLIFSPQGQLIYYQPLTQSAAFNVQVQSYQGQSVLTYWQGYVKYSVGIGRDRLLNHNYQLIATVYAGHGYSADLHDFYITPQGDAFITAYAPIKANLSSVGGPKNGTLLDSIIQEIDIATGQVLWEWHAYGHVPLNATYAGKPGRDPYDYFHINSIQPLPGGNLLISSRHTWAVYGISMQSGQVLFALGGKYSSFKMGRGTQFEWQHDARLLSDGTITLFDNGEGLTKNASQSEALRIRLNFHTHRATLVRAFRNDPPVLSSSQGDVQVLSDGNTFVGWGAAPYFTEYGRRGRRLFTLHLAGPLVSYRAFRFPWWGQPTTPPSIAISPSGRQTSVYASWNGATTVASWRVLAGASPTTLANVGQFSKTSFETGMSVASTAPYFAVQALNAAGAVLGTSSVLTR